MDKVLINYSRADLAKQVSQKDRYRWFLAWWL